MLKLKIFFIAILSVALFGWAEKSWAADHYIRDGAIGLNDGSDWTNAWTTLPATLTRGDTYYIADGAYGPYTFDDPVLGEQYITIKKATAVDYGTATGWSSYYGDGQAAFISPFNIITSYVAVDGSYRSSPSNPDTYGFRINTLSCMDTTLSMGIPPVGYNGTAISDITISHVAMVSCGAADDYQQTPIYSNPLSATNMTITHNYLYGGTDNMQILDWSNSTISYNYFTDNWSSVSHHGEQIEISNCNAISVHNNTFANSETYIIGGHNQGGSVVGLKVYNNIITGMRSGGSGLTSCLGSSESGELDVIVSGQFNNNTFHNINCGGRGAIFVGSLTDANSGKSYAYNNLFYNVANPRMDNPLKTADAIVHTNNAHYNSSGTYDSNEGGTAINTTGDPFVGSANSDYRLESGVLAINAGKTLLAPFDIDFAGTSRPQSSAWDIGAYEYVSSSDTTPPSVPTNLAVQ